MNALPLENLLNNHPVIYCTIDKNGSFSYVNQSASDLLGYQPHELVGTCFMNFVVEQDREKSAGVVKQLFQGAFIDKFVNRYYHRNGSIVTLQWSSQWDEIQQTIYGIAHSKCLHNEVIQQQQYFSLRMKQKRSKLSEAFDQITDAFITLDDQWRVIYTNKSSESILQLPKEQLLANEIWEVLPKAVGGPIEKECKRCLEQQEHVRFEAFYAEPLNKWFEISGHPSLAGISLFIRDITDRKLVEEEMRKLSLIIKHTDNLVLLCHKDGTIKWVNEAFIQTTGYTLEEAAGKRPGDLLGGPFTDIRKVNEIRNKYQKGEGFSGELLYYKKNKEPFWVYISGQAVYDENGNVKELFSIQNNITERKKLEAQLDHERDKLARQTTAAVIKAQEEERSIIGRELHDNVNQLLTTVKLYLEVSLSSNVSKEDLTRRSIKLIQESISEIRNLSKLLSAPTIGKITLVDTVNELCSKIAATKPFVLELNTSGIDNLEVDQDMHLAIYRIIQEHLTNILKHAKASSVSVHLDFVEQSIQLRITDDGKGFDTSSKRKGIGITNMVTRAESVNGHLSITSAPNQGCTLAACFPLFL
jgi:PAS domain S-box-containing protein